MVIYFLNRNRNLSDDEQIAKRISMKILFALSCMLSLSDITVTDSLSADTAVKNQPANMNRAEGEEEEEEKAEPLVPS